MGAGIKEIAHEAIVALLFRDRGWWRDVMGVLRTEGVVACVGLEKFRVSRGEGVVEGELNG